MRQIIVALVLLGKELSAETAYKSFTRLGTPPTVCPDGTEKINGLCYSPCSTGFVGEGVNCVSETPVNILYDSGDEAFDAVVGEKIVDIPITDSMTFSMDITINEELLTGNGDFPYSSVFECTNGDMATKNMPRIALNAANNEYVGFRVQLNSNRMDETAIVEVGQPIHLELVITQSTMTVFQDDHVRGQPMHRMTRDINGFDNKDSISCYVGSATFRAADVTVSNLIISTPIRSFNYVADETCEYYGMESVTDPAVCEYIATSVLMGYIFEDTYDYDTQPNVCSFKYNPQKTILPGYLGQDETCESFEGGCLCSGKRQIGKKELEFEEVLTLGPNPEAVFGQSLDIGEEAFNEKFANSKVIERECPSCAESHKVIFYRRLTDIGNFNAYANMKSWMSEDNNMVNGDFALYSNLDDLINDENRWTFCNFDHVNTGFPRDCGPSGHVAFQWTSARGGKVTKFSILKEPLTADDDTTSTTTIHTISEDEDAVIECYEHADCPSFSCSNNRCDPRSYVLLPDSPRTWDEAQAACQETFGTDLASFHSALEQHVAVIEIKSVIPDSDSVSCWIGFRQYSEDKPEWEWSDGSIADFGSDYSGGVFPWGSDQPDYWNPGEECAIFSVKLNGWKDVTCSSSYRYALCNAGIE